MTTQTRTLNNSVHKPYGHHHKVFSRMTGVYVLLLIGFGWMIYSNSLSVPFYLDDFRNFVNDPHVRLTRLDWKNLASLSEAHEIERPLSMFSFALNYYFGQYNVFGYHLVNIVIHILNALFLFQIIRATLSIYCYSTQKPNDKIRNPDLIAFLSAMLWLTLPLQTQSVTYIVQRENSMASMFYILSILFYIYGKTSLSRSGEKTVTPQRQKLTPYILFGGSILSGCMALASKENAASLPFFILLYEWFFFQNLKRIRSRKLFYWIALALIIFIIISVSYLGSDPFKKILSDYSKYDFNIYQRIISEWRVIIFYLGLIIFPHPSRLNLDYDYPISFSLFHPPMPLLCLFAILSLIGLAIVTAKKDRLISFCILWFFGNLAIESSFIGLVLIFEHRTYLPSMMICFLFVILIFRHSSRKSIPSIFLCCLIALFSFWTYQRNLIWKNEALFWKDCVAKSPNLYRPHNNLGTTLLHSKNYEQAIFHLKKAIKINPSKEKAHYNIGLLFCDQGNFEQAVKHFNESLLINPDSGLAHIGLANLFMAQHSYHKAIHHLKKALAVNPLNSDALYMMGNALLSIGNPDESISYFEQALKAAPEIKEIHNNLGNALIQKNRLKEAAYHFKKILSDNPDHVSANINMGVALSRMDDIDAAIFHYQKALKAAPDIAEAHNNLGVLLLKKNDYNEAKTHFIAAIQLKPDYTNAKSNLEKLQLMMKNGHHNNLQNSVELHRK